MMPPVLVWTLAVPLGAMVAVGVIAGFTHLIFKAGEKEE